MKTTSFRMAAVAAAVMALGTLAACGSGDDSEGKDGDKASGTIAFLMPDRASTRYEEQDRPLFEKKVKELCEDCKVLYQNGDGDPNKQQQQANSAIAQGVDVLVLDAVDTKAAATIVANAQAQDIPVITYDRPITTKPADFYVSFDNEGIGKMIAESLVKKLDADQADGGLLMVYGSPTDDAAQLIKKGMKAGVEGSKYDVLAEYDTPDWNPQKAQDWVSGQITKYRDDIAGAVAANDGTGGGTVAALKAAGIDPVPPVTGNDAEVAAIQRIIAGEQYNTISKPISIVASAAAEAAVAFLKGEEPKADTELFDTPSQLFTPEVVTTENVKKVMFDSGIYTADQVCTGAYAAGCKKLGIN
ncbi:substrate-binding domain-containing protein [Aeromicrobium sp. 636]|uniref:Sugar ABC transporter substrate-binding protein n=1 Tax=Aeromicrobium senzhongii TaxID=2663859 RepID=A0A8I0EX46_9ACTN|nr:MULTISPECIES: sugar ABC transporter substrate-binding protein [Aeromicrobium]MBC9226961.1 sugar ABC transporter substrate-binding protein [Aeromicrobium senzhongii]MCQ3999061.1 substrate-binding domain-containing protein [Aeromicrobium sp. 636]MTB89432.1 substrate-binding domain-containing protein [Aeromicrobium senzhongii]QNL94426.1 sugar ABC transporter substrate-binding protein [Aeromicrobium senzhongii]